MLGTLCQQKTAPENKQLTKGVAADPSNQLPGPGGRGEERVGVRELAAVLL